MPRTVRKGRRLAPALACVVLGLPIASSAQTPPAGLMARCKVAAAASEGEVKRGGLRLLPIVMDRFSISGKDGPFFCAPSTAARRIVDRAPKAATAQPGINLAGQADVKGSLRPTLFTMPETQKRLQAMVDRIATASPYPNSPRPKVLLSANLGYNAEARPDNTIIVWLGVFEGDAGKPATDLTDNDIYWLMAHEYAHHVLHHANRDDVGQARRKAARQVVRIYQRGAMLESTLRYSEASPLPGEAKLDVRDAREAHQRLRFVMDSVIDPMWGRMQEDEADAAGFDLVALTGLRPRITLSTARFEAGEKSRDARIAEIGKEMQDAGAKALQNPSVKSAISSGTLGPAFETLADSVLKAFVAGLKSWAAEFISRDHRSADAREAGLDRYRDAAYERSKIGLPGGGLSTAQIGAITALPELREGLVAARAVLQAQQALEATPSNRAEAAIQLAVANKTRFGREAYVLYWNARLALADGRTEQAVTQLEAARKAPNVSPQAYRELARLYATTGRIPKAQQVIAEGRTRTGDPDYFLPEDVRVLSRQRLLEAVPPVLATCRRTEREQIMLDCQHAAMDVDYAKLTEAQKRQLEENAYFGEESSKKPGWRPSFGDLRAVGDLFDRDE